MVRTRSNRRLSPLEELLAEGPGLRVRAPGTEVADSAEEGRGAPAAGADEAPRSRPALRFRACAACMFGSGA